MAFELPVLVDSSHRAYASLATKQFFFVKLSSNGIELCSGATDKPFGVLQNAPAAGEAAEVMRLGISKVKAGGTIAIGAHVGTDGNGKADSKTVTTDATEYVVGTADEAAVDGDIFTVGINCLSPARAA
jgi:Uncharacterized conserved protein (DUF2190)